MDVGVNDSRRDSLKVIRANGDRNFLPFANPSFLRVLFTNALNCMFYLPNEEVNLQG